MKYYDTWGITARIAVLLVLCFGAAIVGSTAAEKWGADTTGIVLFGVACYGFVAFVSIQSMGRGEKVAKLEAKVAELQEKLDKATAAENTPSNPSNTND